MIEGTKPYRGSADAKKISEASTTIVEAPRPDANANAAASPGTTAASSAAPVQEKPEADAAVRQLDRRAWFRSLVPALGGGLVEILRASNNLERDLEEKLK